MKGGKGRRKGRHGIPLRAGASTLPPIKTDYFLRVLAHIPYGCSLTLSSSFPWGHSIPIGLGNDGSEWSDPGSNTSPIESAPMNE